MLDGLFERAREQGITQQELARRAGIHPVSLSQAKARGDLRLSTLEALAAVVGLEVALVPSQARERVREAIREGTLFQVVTD
ncbi:helix-turn-helix domain-containing protein [Thiolapillus sp.]